MEHLNRYSVAEYKGVAMVVVESELLPPDPAVVVIPLLPDYPAVKGLNPEILYDGKRLILATRLIAAVRRAMLTAVDSRTNPASTAGTAQHDLDLVSG